jgi:hypothetical protein
VTLPPSRMPGIQEGRGICGIVKRILPALGTPIRIPVKVRIAITQIPTLSDHWKLFDHGAFSAFLDTTIATAPTVAIARKTELAFAIPIAIEPAQIHQASGCRTRFILYLLLWN